MPELFTAETLWGFVVTLGFAGAAWALRGVTFSGALAGAMLAFAIFAGGGWGGLGVLGTVFVITWAATRIGYSRKLQLQMAESRRGRSAAQVAANVAAAAVCCILFAILHRKFLLAGAMAALAEAAGDTASSECGEALSARAYLITTMRPVPVGTDGAVSAVGTIAAVLSCLLTATVASAAGIIAGHEIAVVTGAGFAGTLLDSVLGATLERRGAVGNNTVNLMSTGFAGVLATVWLAF